MLSFKIKLLDPHTHLVNGKNSEGQSLSSSALVQAVLSSSEIQGIYWPPECTDRKV